METKLPWTYNVVNGLLIGGLYFLLESGNYIPAIVLLVLLVVGIAVEIYRLQGIATSPAPVPSAGGGRISWRSGVSGVSGIAFSLLFASILAIASYGLLLIVLMLLSRSQPVPDPGNDTAAGFGNSLAICVGLWYLLPLVAGNFGAWMGFRAATARYAGNPAVMMLLGVLVSAVLVPGVCCLFVFAVFGLGGLPELPAAGEPLSNSIRAILALFALLPAFIGTGVQLVLILARRF